MGRTHDIRALLSLALTRCLGVLFALAVLFRGLMSVAFAAGSGDATSREYEIKAAFLYNFTKFIEWPPRSFVDRNAPIVIGVLGDSSCQPALEQLVKDRKVNGRAIAVRRVETARELSDTHLLFVGAGQEVRFEQLRAAIVATPLLTVGESPAFTSAGGTSETAHA